MDRRKKRDPGRRVARHVQPGPEADAIPLERDMHIERAGESAYSKPGIPSPGPADAEETGAAQRLIDGAEENVLREQEEMTQEDNARVTGREPRGDSPMRLRAEPKAHPSRARRRR